MVPKKNNRSTLYDLVHRLTAAEVKQIFRGYQSVPLGQQPAHIRLLNLVQQAKEAHDEAWCEALKLNKDEYRQLKKYLTDKLINLLVAQQGISPSVEITRLIAQAEAFYLRGMHSQALVAFHQASDIAIRYEFIEECIVLNEWLHKVYLHQGDLEAALGILSQHDLFDQLADLKRYQALHIQLLQTERQLLQGKQLNDQEKEVITALLSDPLLVGHIAPKSARAKVLQAVVASMACRLVDQLDHSLVWLQQLMHILHANPEVRLSNPNVVIDSYRNLALTYQALGQNEQLHTLLSQLKQRQLMSASQTLKLNLMIGQLSLSNLLATGQMVQARHEADQLSILLAGYYHDPIFATDVAFSITLVSVMVGNHQLAIRTLATLVNGNTIYGKNYHHERSVRLMELAVQAELNDVAFVQKKLRELKHFLNKDDDCADIQCLSHFFLKYAECQTEADRQTVLSQFSSQFGQMEGVSKAGFGHYFDLNSWIKVRL